MNIAIIGSGISGMMAAYLLARRHEVDVFEKEPHPGGHANTVDADGPDGKQPVDTGFIVYNETNYPHFTRLLNELGVASIPSDMSFGVHNPDETFAYSSCGLGGLFAAPRNLFSPRIYRITRDVVRFNRLARAALAGNANAQGSLRDFLADHRFSEAFIRYYITPMSSAIWSAMPGKSLDFPATTFFRFFKNHGLLSISPDIPWRTVSGGSRSYVEALTAPFRDRLHLNTPVRGIRRTREGVQLSFDDGPDRLYDRVVIAAHADQALRMLADPTDAERRLLGHFPYQRNRVALHNDVLLLPRHRRAWASWNVRVTPDIDTHTPLTMSYHMNRLQRIAGDTEYLVTLNPEARWSEAMRARTNGKRLYFETEYEHPAYRTDSFAVQPELPTLNGQRHTYFCGAYFGYGFHEDGLVSGLNAARALGVDWT